MKIFLIYNFHTYNTFYQTYTYIMQRHQNLIEGFEKKNEIFS